MSKTTHYLQPIIPTVWPQVSVTLCAVVRFTCLYLHKVPEGFPSYILRTGSGWRDGRDLSGLIRCVPSIVLFGVGTQLPRWPVMTRRPNAGAGGGCYLVPSKFVCVKVGYLCPVNPYGGSLRLTQTGETTLASISPREN